MLPWVCSVIDYRGRQNVVKRSVTHCFYHILSHLWSITEQTHGNIPCEQRLYFHCVSYRAKEASADSRSIFYRACAKISTPFAVIKWREFAGIEKIATSLICYAQLKQCSKPVNMVKNRKNPFFLNLFLQISGQIWTVVGRSRLLFARQLITQRKCSFCSQGKGNMESIC